MKILLKGGRVIDPASKRNEIADILIEQGKIKKIAKNIRVKAKTFDIKGKIATPGLIDLHTHLREPGGGSKETISSGTMAAAKGGFTTVCAMPNTNPPVDSVAGVKYSITTSAQEGNIQVLPIGAITKDRRGEELTEIGKMKKIGIVAISDDGTSVMNALVMRRAMEYSRMFDIIIISHSEDLNLSRYGMINEGIVSTKLGLRGIPTQAEEIMVARDISLAELTGCKLHLAHISTARSIALIKDAKKRKLNVTSEVTPHHLALTETDVLGYNTNCKVNPPLRTEKDRKALIRGLKDGVIDCIATDHAPHLDQDKNREFDLAPFGINGLETAIPVLLDTLISAKHLSLLELLEKMTIAPAKILQNEDIGRLQAGTCADITVIDQHVTKEISRDFFLSKSKNSPYIGKKLKGFPVLTLYNGKVVWQDEKIYP
ncbi:MAG: dihydroorotase [Candidatus Omnitrophica bacterium]|nr:dihydroorotase [Candidatus Omnitrophota bacterium]